MSFREGCRRFSGRLPSLFLTLIWVQIWLRGTPLNAVTTFTDRFFLSSKIRGFFGVAAMKEFNANQALIITLDKDASLEQIWAVCLPSVSGNER